MITTPCPDCDPHGFDANMEKFYGPPMMMGSMKVYADPRVPTHKGWGETVVDAKSFARSLCQKHGHRSTSAKRDT